MDNNNLKCAIDHILDAQQKGEINEDNVLYIIENINAAGKFYTFNRLFDSKPQLHKKFHHLNNLCTHENINKQSAVWPFRSYPNPL